MTQMTIVKVTTFRKPNMPIDIDFILLPILRIQTICRLIIQKPVNIMWKKKGMFPNVFNISRLNDYFYHMTSL